MLPFELKVTTTRITATADGKRAEAWQALRRELDNIGDPPQRGPRKAMSGRGKPLRRPFTTSFANRARPWRCSKYPPLASRSRFRNVSAIHNYVAHPNRGPGSPTRGAGAIF